MNSYYNQNYSREEIEDILEKIKNCVRNNRFTISRNANRQENIDFINEYNIRSDKQKYIAKNSGNRFLPLLAEYQHRI